MTTIKKNEGIGQQSRAVSNLGGPTSYYLADELKAVNVAWADRFKELNGGASQ